MAVQADAGGGLRVADGGRVRPYKDTQRGGIGVDTGPLTHSGREKHFAGQIGLSRGYATLLTTRSLHF